MQQLKEDFVADLFRTGAVKSFSLEIRDGHAKIAYKLMDGTMGMVHTKRNEPKQYRIETALRFLRGLGLASVTVEMAGWTLDQKPLF